MAKFTNNLSISSHLFVDISLVLAACLPFLVPFASASRNVDLQGLILIVAGGFAWLAVILKHGFTQKLSGNIRALLAIFATCCGVSLAVNPHISYNLLGSPLIRLGSLGLLACMGCGLVATRLATSTLISRLYFGITGLAMISVPYSLVKFHSLTRIGGIFAQADIFACFLGCGLLLGLQMVQWHPHSRQLLLGNQLFLAILLTLTETRAVLVIVAVLCLTWGFQHQNIKTLKRLPLYAAGLLLLFLGLHHFMPSRLADTRDASASLHYRLQLQGYALQASTHKPLGYGAGNLADALDCSKLSAKSLQTTCREGYFFNSSHNIFIDRALGLGWLGGISYLLLIVLAMYTGLRARGELRILAYVITLISIYYLTNVTSVTLELLLWILMVRCFIPSSANRA